MIKLDTIESDFGTISVYERKSTGSITYEQGGFHQSEADRNGVSLASYVHAIFGLILQAKARRILLVGCAGGTLATMLARAGCNVTAVDVNPASFVLAKKYFALPDDVACRVADGKTFLRSDSQVYDAIVLDAFHGDHVPSHLQSLRFYCLVRGHLAQRGAVFVNVHAKHNFDDRPDRVADCMSDVFPDVRLLDAGGFLERNAIAMAGAVSHLRVPGMIVPPLADRSTVEIRAGGDEISHLANPTVIVGSPPMRRMGSALSICRRGECETRILRAGRRIGLLWLPIQSGGARGLGPCRRPHAGPEKDKGRPAPRDGGGTALESGLLQRMLATRRSWTWKRASSRLAGLKSGASSWALR